MKKILQVVLCIVICYGVIGIGWITKDIIVHEQCKDGIAILGYHGVVLDEDKETTYSSNPYIMSKTEFEKQMKYLYDHQYVCLSMKDVDDYYNKKREVPKKAVCLTFDDGYKNFNTIVKPILKKYNLQATNFVIGSKTKSKTGRFLKTSDLINDEYVEYYSHSYDLHHIAHLPRQKLIETLSIKEIEEDFNKNKSIVSDQYFAFPYGVTSKNAQSYLENSDVSLAFGYNQNRTMTRQDNRYLLPRYMIFANIPDFLYQWYIE